MERFTFRLGRRDRVAFVIPAVVYLVLLLFDVGLVQALAVNCTDCHLQPNTHTAKHDKTGVPRPWCATCHNPNVKIEHTDKRKIACTACHDVAHDSTIALGVAGTSVGCGACHTVLDHLALHDKVSSVSPCQGCHVNSLISLHKENCERCHTSTNVAVQNAIASGAGPTGLPVTCNACHGGHDGPAAHNMLSTSPDCSRCHLTAQFNNILTTHQQDCMTCHGSSRGIVLAAITNGRAGQPVQCENCHTAHDGTVAHNNLKPAQGCAACHQAASFNEIFLVHRADCATCHSSAARSEVLATINAGKGGAGIEVTCENCHGSHNGPVAHDKLSTSINCSGCHATANFLEIKTTHSEDCLLCHTSGRSEVISTILGGSAGQAVNCENCHTAHDGQVAHDHLTTSSNCAGCHSTATFPAVLTTHRGQCSTCHASLRAAVVTTIAAGRAGTLVNCDNCHGSHDGPGAHNNLATAVNCATCHVTAAFSTILATHGGDCIVCHASGRSEVVNTINIGKGVPGTAVNCENCHGMHDGNLVHNNLGNSANCSKCHFLTTFTSVYSTHKQNCAMCHASTRAEVITTIAAGQGTAGLAVNCENCHAGHASDHDMLGTIADCSGCHVSGSFQVIYALHRTDCATCHSSTNNDVKATINRGMTGYPVNCSNCHAVHDGDLAHDKLENSVNCSKCHLGTTFTPIFGIHLDNCAKCHASQRPEVLATIAAGKGAAGQVVNCENCHGGHAGDHDMLATAETCAGCHATASFSEIYAVHKGDCATCHSRSEVAATIEAGSRGTAVNCLGCHGNPDHRAGHDQTYVPSDGCKSCHVANVATEHVDTRGLGCVTCHSSVDPTVQTAITSGMTGTAIYCADCHGAVNHNTAHDQTFVPAANCATCHYQNVVTEHVDRRGLDCLVCHGSTDPLIFNAIDAGMEGNPVFCTACHVGVVGHDLAHLDTRVPTAACLTCHGEDVAVVHVTERKLTCGVCHENAVYKAVIANGVAGGTVTCDQCHGAAIDHASAHNHARINTDGCDKCHNVDVAVEHVNNRGLTCFTCHASTDPLVVGAITTGKGGTDVYCTTCHVTQTGHASAHDMTILPATYCADCHTANVVGEHVDKRGLACSVCHGNAAVAKPIADGKAGIAVDCFACHLTSDHRAAHDMTVVPDAHCTNCHNANVVSEHVDKRGLSCQVCHANSAYGAIIASGMAGKPVDCLACHGQPHHNKIEAQNGNCLKCHTPPASTDDAPVQGACRQCHIDASGFVIRKTTTSPDHAYNTAAKIQDFGACFACHAPTPYHAKPTVAPKWWETDTNIAPGRGTFNIFYNEFRRPKEYYDGNSSPAPVRGYEDLEDYGKEVIQNTQGSKWSQPAISYNWLRINHLGVSYDVPTFDQPAPPAPGAPTITSLDRTSGSSGTTVQINGTNFGTSQGTSYVLFGTSTKPTISSWASTQIRFRVPSLSRTTYQVKVVVNGVSSNTKSFTITY